MQSLGAKFLEIDLGETGETAGGYAKELTPEQVEKQRQAQKEVIAKSDVVITTAQVFGRKPPLQPISGAGIRIDGHFAGGTDHEGALVVEWPQRPERIEVDHRGWTLENDPFDPRPGTTAALRGHVLPLILVPPE